MQFESSKQMLLTIREQLSWTYLSMASACKTGENKLSSVASTCNASPTVSTARTNVCLYVYLYVYLCLCDCLYARVSVCVCERFHFT